MIGEDLIDFLVSLRARLDFIGIHAEFWQLPTSNGKTRTVLFMPRTDPLPSDPSAGLARFIDTARKKKGVIGIIYPDRRGDGYGLSRYQDNQRLNFTRIEEEPDVHFAHSRGFVAKTTATCPERLKALFLAAWIDA
jgi:hypothetical protein